MKVHLDIKNHYCEVTKEENDPRFSRGYALPESTFLYHVLKALKAQGHDVIKKRMWKDGHMVDDTQQYIRTRKYMKTPDGTESEFCVWNNAYQVYDMGEQFNKIEVGESVVLSVQS
jgi:hypothetical protein